MHSFLFFSFLWKTIWPKGDDGTDGDPGLDGLDGDKGPAGDKGPVGDKGTVGDKGDTGTRYICLSYGSVNCDGVLSFTHLRYQQLIYFYFLTCVTGCDEGIHFVVRPQLYPINCSFRRSLIPPLLPCCLEETRHSHSSFTLCSQNTDHSSRLHTLVTSSTFCMLITLLI